MKLPRPRSLALPSVAVLSACAKGLKGIAIHAKAVEDDAKYTLTGCERAGEPVDVVCRMRGTHDVEVLPLTVFSQVAVVAPGAQRTTE